MTAKARRKAAALRRRILFYELKLAALRSRLVHIEADG